MPAYLCMCGPMSCERVFFVRCLFIINIIIGIAVLLRYLLLVESFLLIACTQYMYICICNTRRAIKPSFVAICLSRTYVFVCVRLLRSNWSSHKTIWSMSSYPSLSSNSIYFIQITSDKHSQCVKSKTNYFWMRFLFRVILASGIFLKL